MSGMNPDVTAAAAVGGGEYGTSGSTPLAVGVGCAVVGAVVVVVVVHASARNTRRHGRKVCGRGMGMFRECIGRRATEGLRAGLDRRGAGRVDPAVDMDQLAGDRAGEIREQERDGVADGRRILGVPSERRTVAPRAGD